MSYAGPIPPPQETHQDLVAKNRNVKTTKMNPSFATILLLLLIVVNGFTSHQFAGLWGVITGQKGSSSFPTIQSGFLVLGGELVFLIIMSLLASSSDAGNKVVIALIIVLWIVWGIHNSSSIKSFMTKVTPQNKIITPTGGSTKK